ncbi:MAG: 50S ribosomal protein L29 [Bacteroidota bacterium]
MKIHEIKQMKSEEILKQISEEEKNLLDLKFSHALKQLTNTAKLRLLRRDIAKMKTELRLRQLEDKK